VHEGIGRTELRRMSLIAGKDHPLAKNVMSGSFNGLDAAIFDYAYRSSHRSNAYWISQTVVAFRLPGRTLSAFQLAPQTIAHGIASLIGYRDIDFDDQPEFSGRFLLRGEDERAIRTQFTPRILHGLQSLDDAFNLTVEGAGDCLIVYTPNRKVAPGRIASFARQAASVAAAFVR
jgi:hypothetical protein